MPVSRAALYALSLLSLVVAARSALGKPLSYSMALALAGTYGSLLALGALRPRMQLFADALVSVANDQCAIVVRCGESDVEAWSRALAQSDLIVTFSLADPTGPTLALLEGSPHGIIARVDRSAAGGFSPRSDEVNVVDVVRTWHTPAFGRALRRANLAWLAPRRMVDASQLRLGVAAGDIVAVSGSPDENALRSWRDEIAEARLTPVAIR
jgi:hypothetical protein